MLYLLPLFLWGKMLDAERGPIRGPQNRRCRWLTKLAVCEEDAQTRAHTRTDAHRCRRHSRGLKTDTPPDPPKNTPPETPPYLSKAPTFENSVNCVFLKKVRLERLCDLSPRPPPPGGFGKIPIFDPPHQICTPAHTPENQ